MISCIFLLECKLKMLNRCMTERCIQGLCDPGELRPRRAATQESCDPAGFSLAYLPGRPVDWSTCC